MNGAYLEIRAMRTWVSGDPLSDIAQQRVESQMGIQSLYLVRDQDALFRWVSANLKPHHGDWYYAA